MFNIGPMELVVLVVVGLVVLGPERLPDLARDAARLLRTLRDLAQGARTQLRDELGPEFADLDLRNLNPKTAIRRAVLGDDFDSGFDPADYRFSPRDYFAETMRDEPAGPVSLAKPNGSAPNGSAPNGSAPNGSAPNGSASDGAAPGGVRPQGSRPRPRPRPYPAEHEPTRYDDAT